MKNIIKYLVFGSRIIDFEQGRFFGICGRTL